MRPVSSFSSKSILSAASLGQGTSRAMRTILGTSREPPQTGQGTVCFDQPGHDIRVQHVDGLDRCDPGSPGPTHSATRAIGAVRAAASCRPATSRYWKPSLSSRKSVMPVTALGADWTMASATRRVLARRLADDLAIALVGQVQAVLLVLDRDQPLEPLVEVGHLILAWHELVVVFRVRDAVQFMRPFARVLAAHGAFLLVVLPADALLERRPRRRSAGP